MSMTENMKAFVEHNKNHKVVREGIPASQEKLGKTKDDLDYLDGILYIFSDGTEMVLVYDDVVSLPGFTPKWDFGEPEYHTTDETLPYELLLYCAIGMIVGILSGVVVAC